MFDDLFDTQEQLLHGVKEGQVQSSWDRLPRNCADQLPMPELPRKLGYPIGLKNQGATCYLNSLLQILYHTPELRKVILDLPLCINTPQQPSDFLTAEKRKFMLGFQRLFSEMALSDKNDLSTQFLKQAFGWEGAEHVQQHDIQEAMKIIFDTFERALQGTSYEKNIRQLFRGISSQYKTCKNCTVTSQRLDEFYGLTIQVKGLTNTEESMMSFLTAQSMEGDNKIFCDTCQSKQDMWLGSRLKQLPSILFITFRRFEFDYEKMDRVKINDLFTFNIEYNFSHLLEDSKIQEEYELYGILIHRGSAHGGHYFSYVRDIMQQSDWKKSLEETKIQQNKILQERAKEGQLTQKQKKNREQLQKQNKLYNLKEPTNKNLLENWFEIDDSRCKGIDAQKITSKYEGSQSAYIVFYRRKDLALPQKLQVPKYYEDILKVENKALQKQREIYNAKKKQIIMKIQENNQTLSLNMKACDLIKAFCPIGYSLVNEAKHNNLPYYPMEINSLKQYNEQDTLQKLDIIHQSSWKKYEIQSSQYQEIKDIIQKDKMPFEINILYGEENNKMVFFQDQTLSDLRIKLQHKMNLPYEKQIIKIVTPFKEAFVTDDLKNDDVLLTKLGVCHESQAIIKKLEITTSEQELGEQNVKKKEQEANNLYCFIIERDDIIGIKRMYFDKRKSLKQLMNYIIDVESLSKEQKRRLRNMNGDRLFYQNQYEKKLQQLNFDEEMVKLRIERGQIPIKGDICVRVKMQSQYQSQNVPPLLEQIFDPNTSIIDVKKFFCEMVELDYQNHRVYMTDWMEEPVRSITKEKQSIFDAGFGSQQIICIRDLNSPIGSELLHFEVFQTKTGSPEDVGNSFHFKIQETKTLLELKQQLLKTQNWKDKNLKPKSLRVRQLKRDYMLGVILRDHKKTLKNINFNGNKLVIQVIQEEEELTEDQIVLILKKRNKEKRIYEGIQQVIFNAGKNPSIQALYESLKKQLNVKQGKITLIKYVNFNFQWMQISEKTIDKFLKGKSSNDKKNKKKGKKEEEEKLKDQKDFNLQKAQKEIKEQAQEKKQKAGEEVKNEDKKKKKGKNKNEPKGKDEKRREECLNIRKAPILLKDGDWIGYGLEQQLKGDDYQTDQDLTLRALKKDSKNIPIYRPQNNKGFKLGVNF